MEKKPKNNKKNYDYNYIQFTISDDLKEEVREIIEKIKMENIKDLHYNTISDFAREAVKDKLRRIKNPEVFETRTLSEIDEKKLKQILENVTSNKEKIDLVLEKLDIITKIQDSLKILKELVNRPELKEKEDIIIEIIKEKGELRPKEISEYTGLKINEIYDILSNDDIFELNLKSKRFRIKDEQE